MKISADVFSFIDEKSINEILDNNPDLKSFVEQEVSRMEDEGIIKKCSCPHKSDKGGGHGGCCSGCQSDKSKSDPAYFTAVLSSIFNYYIPDNIKNAINMGVSTYIE